VAGTGRNNTAGIAGCRTGFHGRAGGPHSTGATAVETTTDAATEEGAAAGEGAGTATAGGTSIMAITPITAITATTDGSTAAAAADGAAAVGAEAGLAPGTATAASSPLHLQRTVCLIDGRPRPSAESRRGTNTVRGSTHRPHHPELHRGTRRAKYHPVEARATTASTTAVTTAGSPPPADSGTEERAEWSGDVDPRRPRCIPPNGAGIRRSCRLPPRRPHPGRRPQPRRRTNRGPPSPSMAVSPTCARKGRGPRPPLWCQSGRRRRAPGSDARTPLRRWTHNMRTRGGRTPRPSCR